jgi:hypothetical protein
MKEIAPRYLKAIATAPDLGRGVAVQIHSMRLAAGDVLLLGYGEEPPVEGKVLSLDQSSLVIEVGRFEVHLRPWVPSDGRIAAWPPNAVRWTVVEVRRARVA